MKEAGSKLAIIGFPVDLGVTINGGRAGAAAAPDAIRQQFYRLTPDARLGQAFLNTLARTIDVGDIEVDAANGASLADLQTSLADHVAAHLRQNFVPVILGGGHETTFGHFLGYVEAGRKVNLLNLDAHPDVREQIDGKSHSGSSFRDALLHPSKRAGSYLVAGIQPQSTSDAHLRFIEQHESRYLWADQLNSTIVDRLFRELTADTLVSVDIDVVDQAFAPGVSAPNSGGITPELLFQFAYAAGRSPHVSSFDIVEVNPQFDRDGMTARLAAVTAWHFFRGFTIRP